FLALGGNSGARDCGQRAHSGLTKIFRQAIYFEGGINFEEKRLILPVKKMGMNSNAEIGMLGAVVIFPGGIEIAVRHWHAIVSVLVANPRFRFRTSSDCLSVEPFPFQKFPHNILDIPVLPLDGVVHLQHLLIGDFSRQFRQCLAHFRMARDRGLSNHGDCLVWREIIAIILEHEKIEGGNEPVSRIAGNQIDLLFLQRAIQQPEIHNARRLGKAKAVGGGQAFVTVRTLHELVPKSRSPMRRVSGRLRNCLQMQATSILSSDLNREGVIKAERRTESEMKPPVVFRLHALIHLLTSTLWLLLQNRSKRGAGVLGVEIDASREDGLLADEGSREIKAPLDAQTGFFLQPLREKFAQDCLFREILRANYNVIFARGTARSQK